jgi:selenium metabolism protein YedF
MKTIDLRGKKCPLPLIETKKALRESGKDEPLKIILDNETSEKNVTHFLEDHGMQIKKNQNGKLVEILVVANESFSLETSDETGYCDDAEKPDKSYVVVLAKDRIGEGSDELGHALVGSMLNTIKAMENLPEKIIFMNSGINLVTKGSIFLPQIVELEQKGVTVITCGTCLDYFGKMEELAAGRVSNMHEIIESLLNTGKTINI